MNIVEATVSYESWLRKQLSLVLDDDLVLKHKRVAEAAFPFLRAMYYFWLARLFEHSLADAPEVVAIGDLHVENFGCWRDLEGRLAWGVNDFDEVASLPYTFDLLRLAASARRAFGTRSQSCPCWRSPRCRTMPLTQRSAEPAVDAVRKHATTLDEAHFRHAVEQLADQVASDRKVWHSHQAAWVNS